MQYEIAAIPMATLGFQTTSDTNLKSLTHFSLHFLVDFFLLFLKATPVNDKDFESTAFFFTSEHFGLGHEIENQFHTQNLRGQI